MSFRHGVLAVLVAAVWGANFVALRLSLDLYPPLLLAAIRFGLLAIPTLLFVPRPQVQWRWIIGYGVGFGIVQFSFLYWGLAAGMPAGLASLVLQASAPFTVLLGTLIFKEQVSAIRLTGIAIAAVGLGVIGWQRAEHAAFLPFVLTLAAAFGWAIGNVSARESQTTEPFRLMLWMTAIPPVPMLILSLAIEGSNQIMAALKLAVSPVGLVPNLALLYTVLIATVGASGIWTWLMSRYAAGAVAPFSLLVPVFGMPAAWIAFGEQVPAGELAGAVLVIAGVLLGSRAIPRTPPVQSSR